MTGVPLHPAIRSAAHASERGSALVLAMAVLVLVSATGIALLFVTETEMKAGRSDLRAKSVFYVAEAGLENARETLRAANLAGATPAARSTLDDELFVAAGDDETLNLDPDALRPVYDADGNVSGFTGYGDDLPLLATTSFADGAYAAFLTNDPSESGGRGSLDDTDLRAGITAIGTGPRRSVEIVEAIVERITFPELPATITIVGPSAAFNGGNSNAKDYTGNDCDLAGLHLPVVGVIGSASEVSAEAGVHKPGSYSSGTESGKETVDNISATIDPQWKDCEYLLDLARSVRAAADVVGTSSTPTTQLGQPGAPRIVYIEGDYFVGGGFNGAGLLWVTGTLTFHGSADWTGVIYTVGRGRFQRSGGGNGEISGANFVANVAGPDGVLWTPDDCSGADGIHGTTDDGFQAGYYDNSGGGTGLTGYCSSAITDVEGMFPFSIVQFRQR